ncbi:HAMP domain-containing histidine kinase [Skermanella mucosa]|uniref:sensor histidine kinase n=1 Tax=Skermanella mucosa TaxID=1789672 RepID=UPI00192B38F6|nr:HAMP domain-containing sensor histidine kinase [Skermanella mucosa]UEM21520.1 HAMP domain-containing histidine kinase [Skermanella mucosa]
MPNEMDIQDQHGSIFSRDAVVRLGRSHVASPVSTRETSSTDTSLTRTLNRILAAANGLDEAPTPGPALGRIAALLDTIPGISGAEFQLGNTGDQHVQHLETLPADPLAGGSLRLVTRRGPAEDRTHLIPLRAGRSHHGWLRLRHNPDVPLPRLSSELATICRLVALHLEKRRSADLLEQANRDIAELRATPGRAADRKETGRQPPGTRDADFQDKEQALLAIARAQGAVLRGEPARDALESLSAALRDLTGSSAVRVGVDGSLDFESPASPLPPGLLAEARSAVASIVASESRRVELCEARQRADRAEFADLAKTEFLATMSHELRTPLNAILGFSELLKNQTFGPLGSARYVGYASDIFDSGKLLLQIISDIMDVAKVETGRIHLAQDWVDADHLVSSVVRLIEPRAAAAGIAFETRIMREPLPRLWADERLIKQALLNILSNAVKFTPPGGSIRLTVDTVRLDSGDTGLGIEIADTGLGIAASELTRVFEPFHRGDCATNRRFEGTGLGLPLARSFIDLHGGSLTLDSVQGAGTTVRISLPPTAGEVSPAQ